MPRVSATNQRRIRQIFRALEAAMGPQHWWPAGSAFEVVVGAYLTQNTAWSNVELAIANLKHAGLLSLAEMRNATTEQLEELIRPAGYFRQKAARLKNFIRHLDAEYAGSLEAMFARPVEALRAELLALHGIGPETADSILLYAAGREVFVVDAYTRRIFERHQLAQAGSGYEEIRAAVETALSADAIGHLSAGQPFRPGQAAEPRPPGRISIHPPSAASRMPRSELARRYNEFHALLVQTGKHYCLKAAPRCQECPLRAWLPKARPG
jgi:endonuclease III related protein